MNFRIYAALAVGLFSAVSANAAGDAAKGSTIANQVCLACHGADGNSPIPMYPKLAGQHPEYIAKQLKEFKSGDRKNAVMAGMVITLTPEDMDNLGAYYGSQAAKGGTAKSNGKGSVGEKIYKAGILGLGVPACASCHGPAGAGVPVQFPRLAGQHADYTVAQLQTFRSGERANDAAKMMRMIASKLTDQDMAAVADYIQGLR
ncbi:cytochrome subunit of sulfide dehydrogenase [Methylophilaceae bacterium]|nr:cytochrome subunit of sulfide dehydrogenase [Methylophilaceae bacterium]